MKKIIYVIAFAFVCATAFTACSEEEIGPKTELENGGGTGSLDPIKNN